MGYEEFHSYKTKLHSQRTELEQLQSCTMVHPLYWQGILKHKGRWSRNRACHRLSWSNSMLISLHKTNFQNETSVFTLTAIVKYYSIVGEFNNAAQFLLRFKYTCRLMGHASSDDIIICIEFSVHEFLNCIRLYIYVCASAAFQRSSIIATVRIR